jgi:hypothetical protein
MGLFSTKKVFDMKSAAKQLESWVAIEKKRVLIVDQLAQHTVEPAAAQHALNELMPQVHTIHTYLYRFIERAEHDEKSHVKKVHLPVFKELTKRANLLFTYFEKYLDLSEKRLADEEEFAKYGSAATRVKLLQHTRKSLDYLHAAHEEYQEIQPRMLSFLRAVNWSTALAFITAARLGSAPVIPQEDYDKYGVILVLVIMLSVIINNVVLAVRHENDTEKHLNTVR